MPAVRRGRRRHRDQVAAALRRAGAAHLRLRTDRDWIADVLRFVLAPQARLDRGRAGAPQPHARAGEAW